MEKLFDITLFASQQAPSQVRLAVSHGAGHIVVEMDGADTVKSILAFIAEHRTSTAANWMGIGKFASQDVTFCLTADHIIIIVDSDLSPDSFAQSCGLHIPRKFLDEFVSALDEAHKRFTLS